MYDQTRTLSSLYLSLLCIGNVGLIEIERSIASERETQGLKYQLSPISTIEHSLPHSLFFSPILKQYPLPAFLSILLYSRILSATHASQLHLSTQVFAREVVEFYFRLHSYQFLQHPHDLYDFPPIPPILLLLLNPRVPVSELVQFRSVSFTTSPPFPCFTR